MSELLLFKNEFLMQSIFFIDYESFFIRYQTIYGEFYLKRISINS